MPTYRPRRASKRWLDADCPKGVLAIFDDRKSGERYTVLYAEVLGEGPWARIDGVGMSGAPFHPQGVGQHFELTPSQAAAYRYANSRYACRWSDLPEDCRRLVRRDLEDGEA